MASSPVPRISALPSLLTFRLRFVAASDQKLPPLPTTALHGGFGHALAEIACLAPQRQGCEGCPHCPTCPYALLFEPRGRQSAHGVTDRAPPPVVFAPESRIAADSPFLLRQGDSLALRVTIIGAAHAQHAPLVLAAVRAAARAGLGIDPDRPDGPRPSLQLESVDPLPSLKLPVPSAVELEFLSPARLTRSSVVQRSLDAQLLYDALVRRADILAQLYGSGPVQMPTTPPFRIRMASTRSLDVTRYSSRQQRRIDLRGVLGVVVLEGDLASVWPVLSFCERAQVGKATSQGFGRYRLAPVGD